MIILKNILGFRKIRKANKNGFSLVELAVVLVIISTMLGGGITVFDKISNASKVEETRRRMQVIAQAVDDYYDKFGAGLQSTTITNPVTYEGWGFSDTSNKGGVPVYSLRIPPEYAFDAWGNRFVFCATLFCTVKNYAGTTITSNAYAVVISAGPNQNGAYMGRKGNKRANGGNTAENDNMDLGSASITSSPATSGFDDLVYFITGDQITRASATGEDYFEQDK